MKSVLTFVSTFILLQLNAQVWQKKLEDPLTIVSVSPTLDNGSIITGYASSANYNLTLIKVDASGNKEWKKEFTDITLPNDYTLIFSNIKVMQDNEGSYWLNAPNSRQSDTTTTIDNLLLLKLDKSGNLLFKRALKMHDINIHSLENQIVIMGVKSSSFLNLVRLKSNGDTINTVGVPFLRFVRNSDYISATQKNGVMVFSFFDTSFSRSATRLDLNGTVLSRNFMPPIGFRSNYPRSEMVKTSDGGFLVPDSSTIYKIDSLGRYVWFKSLNIGVPNGVSFFTKSVIAARKVNGEFLAIKQDRASQILYLHRYAADGTLLNVNEIKSSEQLNNMFFIKTAQGGFILAGNTNDDKIKLIKLDENGFALPYFIKGNVFNDRDNDCKLTANDIPIQRVLVIAQSTGQPDVLALTDTAGNYTLNVDAGTYTVSVSNPNVYMQPCTPSVTKTISSANGVEIVDFPLKTIISCALMEVDVSTPRLRRCFNNTYTVSYCNKGSVTAMGSYVNITLDSLLEFVSADKTVFSKNGRTYRFNLGDIPINDCKTFDIIARVRCGDSTRLNQTLCVEAKIYPDTLCSNNSTLWSGASLLVQGSCQNDSVTFVVRNSGTAVAEATVATVAENLIARSVNIPALAPNAAYTQRFKSNSNTWRMLLKQVPNHPYSTQPTTFVEGCRTNSSAAFVTGIAPAFANDDAHTSIDLDCQPIIGAFDPNDKTGYPLGTGVTKAIGQNQDIEYLIRFQNTGTDTAFTVVVRDTIDITHLDIKSIEWGTSSHKYMPEIYRDNILKFTFDNILLVDSFTNEPASNGFVKFRIKQKKDVAFGTKIQNSAGIYFDFNDPVITNKTLHTVSSSLLSTIFEKNITDYNKIPVYPNPVTESAVIDLSDTPLSYTKYFELFDISGKLIRTEPINNKTYIFHRKNLAKGMYMFKIKTDTQILGVGKIIIP